MTWKDYAIFAGIALVVVIIYPKIQPAIKKVTGGKLG